VKVAENGAIAAASFAGGGPSASALFHLRRLQTFEDKKRSTLDAMNYSASVGLTAHLDQVLFPTPGPLHPNQILSNLDQYRMYDAWLALHREGKVREENPSVQRRNPLGTLRVPPIVPIGRSEHCPPAVTKRAPRHYRSGGWRVTALTYLAHVSAKSARFLLRGLPWTMGGSSFRELKWK
jgi:hypothetical protein